MEVYAILHMINVLIESEGFILITEIKYCETINAKRIITQCLIYIQMYISKCFLKPYRKSK